MGLILFLQSLDWGDWLRGLISGFIQGGTSVIVAAFTVGLMDNKDYNPTTGKFWTLLGVLFLSSGIAGMAGYLNKNPIPGIKHVTTTLQTTEVKGKPTVKITTIEEAHTEVTDKDDNV